jgi:fructose/tagatose bisphosphate aldolase
MKMLKDILQEAQQNKVAVGHFNFSELIVLRAVSLAASELNLPVMVGVSEGERAFVGVRQAAALVRSIREEFGQPIFLNADHTHSIAKAEEAARAGFDEIIFDGSALPSSMKTSRVLGRQSRLSNRLAPRSSSKGKSDGSAPPRRFLRRCLKGSAC